MNAGQRKPNGLPIALEGNRRAMTIEIASIGFGEAARAFAPGWIAAGANVGAFDIVTDAAMQAAYARHGVHGHGSAQAAVTEVAAVLSLVTADQSLAVARAAAPAIAPGTWWLDFNSVAPATKRATAALIDNTGGRYADVAVMSPVDRAGSSAPLLVSGAEAQTAAALLGSLGFTRVRVVGGDVGAASAIKMIRSVMVKGLEALSAECALAAHAAEVLPEVIASLDASWPGADWARRFDYNLDRMMVHGGRRAAEMSEVARMLGDLGVSPLMSQQTAQWQRGVGAAGINPPIGLAAKLDALRPRREDAA